MDYQEIETYKQIQLFKIDTLILLQKDKSNLFYLNLLPNVSYNYNPVADRNFLSVGLSLSSFATYFQRKNRNKIEVEKLRFQLYEKLESQVNRLYKEYEELQRDSLIIALEQENYNLSLELFELKKQQYENDKITLESWLQVQQSHKSKAISIESKKQAYSIRKANFHRQIKSPL